jgi:hypothetical protein
MSLPIRDKVGSVETDHILGQGPCHHYFHEIIRFLSLHNGWSSKALPPTQVFLVKVIKVPLVAAARNNETNYINRGNQLRAYYAYNPPLRHGPYWYWSTSNNRHPLITSPSKRT